MATKKAPPFRRVNLKLKPAAHTALSLFIAQQRLLGHAQITIQSYLHSLVQQDMLKRGFLREKTGTSTN